MPPTRRTSKDPPKKQRAPQPKQVGSLFGLVDPSNPFAGIAGTGAPAKTTKRPSLTEQVALAKARRDRLKPGSGGLLSPAQRAAEEKASTVRTTTRFATPPPEREALVPRETPRVVREIARAAAPTRVAGRSGVAFRPGEERGDKGLGDYLQGPLITRGGVRRVGSLLGAIADVNERMGRLGEPLIGKENAASLGHELGKAVKVGNYAVGTGAATSLAAFGIGSPDILTRPALDKKSYVTPEEPLARIQSAGLSTPDVKLPKRFFEFGGTAYASTGRDDLVDFKDFASMSGWDLSAAGRKEMRKRMLDQGWSGADADGLPSEVMVKRAFSKPPKLAYRLGLGLLGDAVLTGSQAVGIAGLGSEALQGRGVQAAEDLAGTFKAMTPGLSDHPALDTFVAHPGMGLVAAHAALKTGGSVGHLRRGAAPDRLVTLKGAKGEAPPIVRDIATRNPVIGDIAEVPNVVNRGPRSKNLVVAAAQATKDYATSKSQRLSAQAHAAEIDRTIRDIRDREAAAHLEVQPQHRQAALKIRNKRRDELTAYLDYGGEVGIENALRHFTLERIDGNPNANRWIDLLERARANPPSTPDEIAYVDTLRSVSGHTSDVLNRHGYFGDVSQLFRQYETPIEMANSAGDPLAATFIAARELKEDLYREKKTGVSDFKRGKTSEVERDVKHHGRKAATSTAAIQKQQRALDEWKVKDAEIRARQPKLEKVEEAPAAKTGPTEYATLKEASAAAKDAPGAKVEKVGKKFVVRRPGEKPVEKTGPKYPPGTMGPHRKAVKAWKQEMAAHQAKKPKVTGVARAGGRKAAHETEVSQQGKRLERLTDDRLPIDERIELAKQYEASALEDFVARHLEQGGVEPARIARVKPKPESGADHPRRKAGAVRVVTAPKAYTQKRSSGRTARTGAYMYDHRAPLHENAEAQRISQHVGVFEAIRDDPSTIHGESDGSVPLPDGYVRVNEQNYRSLEDTTVPWDDGMPTNVGDWEREHSLRQSLYDRIKKPEENPRDSYGRELIPAGKYTLIPKARHERILEWVKPQSQDGAVAWFDRQNARYQRLLIGIYPSTWTGNAPGSVPLAVASGANNPRNFVKAWRLGRAHENRAPRPASIQGLGASGSQLPVANEGVVMRTAGFGRGLSQHGEDYSAGAAWFGQVMTPVEGQLALARRYIPVLDKIMPDKYKGLAHELGKTNEELYRALATGNWDNGMPISGKIEELRQRSLNTTEDFMGVARKPESELSRIIGRPVLFHRWLGHIIKLNMLTLPIKHPRRAAFLNSVSAYGNQYREEHGVYPDWMGSFFPLDAETRGGSPGVRSVSLGQFTPMGSHATMASAGEALNERSPLRALSGVTSPLLKPLIDAALQVHDNSTNLPFQRDRSASKILLAGLENAALIGKKKFYPSDGYEPTSNFITGRKKKRYYVYEISPGGALSKKEIPWDERPGPRSEDGPEATLTRVMLGGLMWNPTGGQALDRAHTNDETWARYYQKQREDAEKRARRRDRERRP